MVVDVQQADSGPAEAILEWAHRKATGSPTAQLPTFMPKLPVFVPAGEENMHDYCQFRKQRATQLAQWRDNLET